MKRSHIGDLRVHYIMSESSLLIRSSSWVLAVAWFNRFLGFASVFILARILTPEDFGAFATLLLVVQLASVLTDIGVEQYYVQAPNVTREDLNSCWTLNLLVKATLSFALLISSSLILKLLERQTLVVAMMIMSFLPLINAMSNGFIIHLKRNLAFHRFAKFGAFAQIAGSATSIAIAWYFASYWALVCGMMINAISQSLLSYFLLSERTTLEFTNFSKLWIFGKWLLIRNAIAHVRAKFDVWYAASMFSLSNVGGYNTIKDVAMLPSREIVGPLFQVFFSYMSQDNRTKNNFERTYATCLAMLLLCTPMAAGLFLIAEDVTYILLGEQWIRYAPVLANLAILILSATAGDFISDALVARGMVKHVFAFDFFTLIMSLVFLLLTFQLLTTPGSLSIFRAILSAFMFISSILWIYFSLKLNALRLIRMLSAIALCTSVMVICVFAVKSIISTLHLRAILCIVSGTVSYLAALCIVTSLPIFSAQEQLLLKKIVSAIKVKLLARHQDGT